MAHEIMVTQFRPVRKGDSLQGFVTLRLPSGLVLHDLTWHQRQDGARWVGLPAKQYTKQDGSIGWTRLVEFVDREAAARFQRLAKQAIDRYFTEHPPQSGSRQRLEDSTMITAADMNLLAQPQNQNTASTRGRNHD